jgi:hypothetical protein
MRQALELALEALESAEPKYTKQRADQKTLGGSLNYWKLSQDQRLKAITAIKEALAQPEQEPVNKYCCHFCFSKSGQMFLDRMIRCHDCGNKRCPKATSHELPCTNSNEPNQVGSIYTTPPHRKPLSDEQLKEIWLKGKDHGDDWLDVQGIARAIEAAHGIKE